jgi:hypothetical protein
MAASAPREASDLELPSLLIPGLIPPLLGIIGYGILRESYVWFYGRYGVVPEDVGITQARMLTGVLRILHLWTLQLPGSPAINFVIVLGTIAAYFAGGRWLLHRLHARQSTLKDSAAARHPVVFGFSVLILVIVLLSAWVLPKDRDFAGRKLQLRQGVRPTQLAILAIQADPVRLIWIGDKPPPSPLRNKRLVYLGRADGTMVLYDPPDWSACEVSRCRGVVWRVNVNDALLRVEVDPVDTQAPEHRRTSTSHYGQH